MKKIRLMVVASLIAGSALAVVPAHPALACAPDPDGVDPCQSQTCYDLNHLLYKLTHQYWLACPE